MDKGSIFSNRLRGMKARTIVARRLAKSRRYSGNNAKDLLI